MTDNDNITFGTQSYTLEIGGKTVELQLPTVDGQTRTDEELQAIALRLVGEAKSTLPTPEDAKWQLTADREEELKANLPAEALADFEDFKRQIVADQSSGHNPLEDKN